MEAGYLGDLQKAIERKYQCLATYSHMVFVSEEVGKNEIVWCGYVEVFDLTGHRASKRCYAWQHVDREGIKIVTVLESHFIDSAQRAVGAAVFVDAQRPVAKPVRCLGELLKKHIRAAREALYEPEVGD